MAESSYEAIAMKKKLLFLTPELPFPSNSGGKLKSQKLLECFSEVYDVTVVCPLKLDDHLHLASFQRSFSNLQGLYTSPVDVPRTAMNLLRSYASGVPLNVLRSYSPALAVQVAAMIHTFDTVFIDHYEVAQYVPVSYTGKRIYHAHNAYHKLWQRYSEKDSGANLAYRLVAGMEATRVRNAEVAVCRDADLVFASPNDIDALVAAGAPAAVMRETYHLGDDRQLYRQTLRFDETEPRLLYVGNLAWEPNRAGLEWFLEQVWPQLTALRPDLQFEIVGRNPGPRLQRLVDEEPGVELRGFVENLEDVYPTSRISVAPLWFGAGMKVTVLDAMARGIPVVTTPVGAGGIAVENGEHLLVCDDAGEMVEAILRLLVDQLLWQRLSQQSRALVRERYSWPGLLASMLTAMDRQLIKRRLRSKLLGGVNELRHRTYGAG